MPHFGRTSLQRLDTCDRKLRIIMEEAIKVMDFSVLCGHRGKEDQNKAFADGKSQLKYPASKHNQIPSQAIDITPYPIPDNWGEDDPKELAKFYLLAGIMLGIAHGKGIKLRWGGDWNGDNDFQDNNFDDLLHYELVT